MVQSSPQWLKKRLVLNDNIFKTKDTIARLKVNTVCESSLCPNLNECFSRRVATFMILGRICTRACGFCSVRKHELPGAVDTGEPARVVEAVRALGLKYAVITSVTRDDLDDGGAEQFVKVIDALRRALPDIKIETLVPDFGGSEANIAKVVRSSPDVFSHNIETVGRLYPIVRSGADYKRSLGLLALAKDISPQQVTKSGIMVGLGETREEVIGTLKDIRQTGCSIMTIGQYLRPSPQNLPVKNFISPEEFGRYKDAAEALGFKYVSSGPFVRSSYQASEGFDELTKGNTDEGCYATALGGRGQ